MQLVVVFICAVIGTIVGWLVGQHWFVGLVGGTIVGVFIQTLVRKRTDESFADAFFGTFDNITGEGGGGSGGGGSDGGGD